jgi:signal transduction histidine kinase
MIIALLIVLLGTVVLMLYFQRKSARLEHAIKRLSDGKLDKQSELRSGEEARLLANSINIMTERLRDQINREMEAKQFESFVRFSAMLTHDLKNAIEALSLTVSSMERHFDNELFRKDAMKALMGATDRLRGLVARINTTVTSLSGENERPRLGDLVPVLQKVVSTIAEPFQPKQQIHLKLPDSLFAVIDAERMEKVVENLIINALDSMSDKAGILTVEAGETVGGKVFFTVSDTGVGISADFIRERLFRPFATTKKKGIGLGLYTCREVVRIHGGSIEVTSVEGSGTTFKVILPCPSPVRASSKSSLL